VLVIGDDGGVDEIRKMAFSLSPFVSPSSTCVVPFF
jgi:hypothetical protein